MARSWKAKRARVAVVEHDQVEHRRGLELAEIARAVGDGAVAELERDPHRGLPVDRRLGERPKRAGRDELRTLEPPPEIEETPAGAARHVLLGEPRQDGDELHDLIERREQRIEIAARQPQPLSHLDHHRAGRRDHVDRKALAHRAGQALDGVEHGRQAAIVGGDRGEALLEGGVLRRRQGRGLVHQVGLARAGVRAGAVRGLRAALTAPVATLVAVVRSRRASLSRRSM